MAVGDGEEDADGDCGAAGAGREERRAARRAERDAKAAERAAAKEAAKATKQVGFAKMRQSS